MNEFVTRLNGTQKQVKIIDEHCIKIEGLKYNYTITELIDSKVVLKVDNKFYDAKILKNVNSDISLLINGKTFDINIKTDLQEKAFKLLAESQGTKDNSILIKSPMPGLVLKICKKAGDQISKGDTIMILEAMKMENEIKSNKSGILHEIFVNEGMPIEKNVTLFSII